MKNNKRKSSTAKKLLPAFTMLAVSAVSLASSTYAWFSLSKDVTVSGMSIKATSEGGLLILNETDEDTAANWKTSATASYSGTGVALLPTSTKNASNWFYATSTDYDDAKQNQAAAGAYTALTLARTGKAVEGTTTYDGVGYATDPTGFSSGFYLMNEFYIKSSGAAITSNLLEIQDLQVTGNTAVGDAGSDASKNAALDKALRVAVVFTPGSNAVGGNGSLTHIYSPLYDNGSQPTYIINHDGADFTPENKPTAQAASGSTITTIPSNSTAKAGTIKASVYLYFEGEDANCKSSNLATALDDLSVSIKFGLAQGGAQYGNSGNNNQQQQAASTPTGTYTITRSGDVGSYTYSYSKADGATFPTAGDYTWALNGGTAGTYAEFEAALAAANWSDGNMTVTVAANA